MFSLKMLLGITFFPKRNIPKEIIEIYTIFVKNIILFFLYFQAIIIFLQHFLKTSSLYHVYSFFKYILKIIFIYNTLFLIFL